MKTENEKNNDCPCLSKQCKRNGYCDECRKYQCEDDGLSSYESKIPKKIKQN
jgi:hypothetical protein